MMIPQTVIYKGCLATIFLFGTLLVVTGQEENTILQPRHLVDAGFGFTFIPVAGGLGGTEASGLFVPSEGLDYFFRFA